MPWGDTLDAAFAAFFRGLDEAERYGTVNTEGWGDDGRPIGGHLTWDAVAGINSDRCALSEATGLDYDWIRHAIG